jgi:hypothetical protein
MQPEVLAEFFLRGIDSKKPTIRNGSHVGRVIFAATGVPRVEAWQSLQ